MFPYSLNKESIQSLLKIIQDSFFVNVYGIPKINSKNPVEIAKQILKTNAKPNILWAASGHFEFMWVVDFGVSFNGLSRVKDKRYLKKIIQFVIDISFQKGYVPTCFSSTKGFNIPFYRYDNLPWLIYTLKKYQELSVDKIFLQKNQKKLQLLVASYESNNLNNGLLGTSINKDWIDTVLRPSSTYNNLCVLMMLEYSKSLGLKTKTSAKKFRELIIQNRFKNGYLTDYLKTNKLGVDATVLAVYLKLFNKGITNSIIKSLERSSILLPVPIKLGQKDYSQKFKPFLTHFVNDYHTSIWIHLGLMYINGLKRMGMDFERYKDRIDQVIIEHKNFIEVLDKRGRFFRTIFHSSAYNFSMGAAQYLELTLS